MKIFGIFIIFIHAGTAQQTVAIASALQPPPDPKKVERLEQNFSPQVKLFIARCLDDGEHKFVNAHAWLKLQEVAQPDKDQMWEILSGLVWNVDRERARKIALEIKNIEKQKAVLRHYDGMEDLPQPRIKND